MLLEFQCKNFKSIGDQVTFSMMKEYETEEKNESLINANDRTFLKKAVIYGANGSGKTNFLQALGYVKWLVSTSHNNRPEIKIIPPFHKLYSSFPTEFIIHFTSRNNIRYSYGFSLYKGLINEEFLNYYPNGRITKIFNRTNENIEYGERFSGMLRKVSQQFLMENRLLLSCAGMFSNVEEVKNAFIFFDQDIVVYPSDDHLSNNWNIYSANIAMKNDELRNKFVEFSNSVGNTQLKNVFSIVKEEPINENLLKIFSNDNFKKQLLAGKNYSVDVKFVYPYFDLGLMEESVGNQKLFELFFPLIDILNSGKVFLCDELERSLHPLIVKEIISLFSKNSSNAQLIFNTHNTSILSPDIFRRDEIWFTELNEKNRVTDLYSLSEFKGIRKEEMFGKNYIKGKYSAIPAISTEGIERIMFSGGGSE